MKIVIFGEKSLEFGVFLLESLDFHRILWVWLRSEQRASGVGHLGKVSGESSKYCLTNRLRHPI